jgi:O-antigen ligase
MDFFALILFLSLYFLRPHEWITVVGALRPMQIAVFLALLGMFHRYGARLWREIIKTPQDWMMMGYFLWFVGSNPQPFATLSSVNNLFIFYLVATLTLSTTGRIKFMLNWWALLILGLALMAVLSEYGFDPTESWEVTNGRFKGRLSLSLSIYRNPNALGHTVVPVIVMLYFLGIWQRPVFIKIATMFVLILPLYCVYLTQSKGAFLSGFAMLLMAVTFRRPKVVQVSVFIFALSFGWAAMQALPRMGELDSSKTDEAIQGRVMAFQFGMDTLKNRVAGVGYPNFESSFMSRYGYAKAPHSSYVRVGGELGLVGLFLFVGILCTCLRTLYFARTVDEEEERVRRTLFVMLLSYMVSSWMVGWMDRATFFLIAGAISAFHRQLIERQESEVIIIPEIQKSVAAFSRAARPTTADSHQDAIGFPQPGLLPPGSVTTVNGVKTKAGDDAARPWYGIRWNRVGLLDIFFMVLMTGVILFVWQYMIRYM